jgi:hypothetical protein
MERGMMGNYHVPCGAGEKLEITSNAYLLPTKIEQKWAVILSSPFLLVSNQLKCSLVE